MKKNFIVLMICCTIFSLTPLLFAQEDPEVLKARIAELEKRIAELERIQEEQKDPDMVDEFGRWDPFREMARMRQNMQQIFDDDFLIPQGGLRMPGLTTEMLLDDQFEIKDEGDSYLITSDVPGMSKESIQVEARDQMLIISGKRDEKVQEEQPGVFRQQHFFGTFSRSLPIPPDASTETLDVEYAEDVLKIRLKKKTVKN